MIEREHIEATQGERLKKEFHDRADAERAVERLHHAGFKDDQITMTTHGASTKEDGTFVRGGIEVIVLAGGRVDDAERILTAD